MAALRRLPGVGVKSATRMAHHLLQNDREGAYLMSQAIAQALDKVGHCERCHTLSRAWAMAWDIKCAPSRSFCSK